MFWLKRLRSQLFSHFKTNCQVESSNESNMESEDVIESTEDPLNAYRVTANETSAMSHVPTELEIDNKL